LGEFEFHDGIEPLEEFKEKSDDAPVEDLVSEEYEK
jgi:hypothetical protein